MSLPCDTSSLVLEWARAFEPPQPGEASVYGEIESALTGGYVAIWREPKILRLTDIYLPEAETHRGWGGKILDALETKADLLDVSLVVGPLLTFEDHEGKEEPNYLERMVVARGYQPYPPFSAIRRVR